MKQQTEQQLSVKGRTDHSISELQDKYTLEATGKLTSNRTGKPVKSAKLTTGVVSAHRATYALHNGEWPQFVVDHSNGDRSDHRPSNLRDVTTRVNNQNRHKVRAASGLMGVYEQPDGRWLAGITRNYKFYNLGYHPTKEQASQAYQEARAGKVALA